MGYENINIGTVPNDQNADTLREGFDKINNNFASNDVITYDKLAQDLKGTKTLTANEDIDYSSNVLFKIPILTQAETYNITNIQANKMIMLKVKGEFSLTLKVPAGYVLDLEDLDRDGAKWSIIQLQETDGVIKATNYTIELWL